MGRLFLIKVILPEQQTMTFTTDAYAVIDGRVKFLDRFGKAKDFPQEACFIEEKTKGGF